MDQRDLPPTVLACEDEARCDCEGPGYYCCGIPGILAVIENGKMAPGAIVERCDACERFESDEAARQKLVELGMLYEVPRQPTFTMYAYAIVQTKHEGVAAASDISLCSLPLHLFVPCSPSRSTCFRLAQILGASWSRLQLIGGYPGGCRRGREGSQWP